MMKTLDCSFLQKEVQKTIFRRLADYICVSIIIDTSHIIFIFILTWIAIIESEVILTVKLSRMI